MSAPTKRRLERLADDMQELADSSHRVFGFSLILGSKNTRIRSPQTWGNIARHVTVRSDDNIVFTTKPYRAEVHPDASRCIWWWGDPEGIEQFKRWTERMSSVVQQDPGLLTNVRAEPGLFGMLDALCQFAQEQANGSDLVRRRSFTIPKSFLGQPTGGEKGIGRSKFVMIEAAALGPMFAKAVLGHILGVPTSGPRLIVDRNNNTATLDGMTYPLGKELVLMLDVLLKANGNIVSASSIKEREPTLDFIERLYRLINRDLKRACPQIREAVENVPKKGYRISSEFLA